jgi:hypothetical protein
MAETTNFDTIGSPVVDAPIGRILIGTAIPSNPEDYYGGSQTLHDDEWRGGEVFYSTATSTGGNKLYIQVATSGRTAEWRRVVTTWTAA